MNAKTISIVLLLVASIGAAQSAVAQEVYPGRKIVVRCWDSGDVRVRMTQIADAVKDSHYWAPQAARREMLELARKACAKGVTRVVFVPVTPTVEPGSLASH